MLMDFGSVSQPRHLRTFKKYVNAYAPPIELVTQVRTGARAHGFKKAPQMFLLSTPDRISFGDNWQDYVRGPVNSRCGQHVLPA